MSKLPRPTNGNGLAVATHPIGASGLWCYSTPKAALEAVRGYNPNFLSYAGGEVYLELKYWLLGGHVVLLGEENEQEPISGVHWSAPRRYQMAWKEWIHDVLLAVSVVAPDCLDEVGYVLQRKSHLASPSMALLREQARQAGAEEAQWIFENRKHGDTAALEASWTKNGVFSTLDDRSPQDDIAALQSSLPPRRAAGNALDRPLRLRGGRRLRADSALRRRGSVPIATLR